MFNFYYLYLLLLLICQTMVTIIGIALSLPRQAAANSKKLSNQWSHGHRGQKWNNAEIFLRDLSPQHSYPYPHCLAKNIIYKNRK